MGLCLGNIAIQSWVELDKNQDLIKFSIARSEHYLTEFAFRYTNRKVSDTERKAVARYPRQAEATNTVYISFNAGIDQKTAQTLVAVLIQQIQAGFDHLYILFSTSGGTVADGMALYNTIRALPVTVTMHNVGNVDSVGVAIYLAGKYRYTCKHSTFMFHGVYSHFEGGALNEGNLVEKLNSIRADQKRIADIVADSCLLDGTPLPSEQVQLLFSHSETKDADYAVKVGMAHEVRDVHIPPGATVIPLVFDV